MLARFQLTLPLFSPSQPLPLSLSLSTVVHEITNEKRKNTAVRRMPHRSSRSQLPHSRASVIAADRMCSVSASEAGTFDVVDAHPAGDIAVRSWLLAGRDCEPRDCRGGGGGGCGCEADADGDGDAKKEEEEDAEQDEKCVCRELELANRRGRKRAEDGRSIAEKSCELMRRECLVREM
ncbi:hypothetical protein BDZ88DRAFT_413883 [Geranomyces variabilis]|nr:hypothetical protein BDZ88DRAFT_413883 [Geranomyces variabilis]